MSDLDPTFVLALTLSLGATFLVVVVAVKGRPRGPWLAVTSAISLFAAGPFVQFCRQIGYLPSNFWPNFENWRTAAIGVVSIVAVIAMERWIAYQRRLLRDLTESETRMASISELLPVGIFQTDLDGRCTYVNEGAARITGMSAGDTIGDGWMRGLYPEDLDAVLEGWQQATLEGRDFKSEYRFRRPDGVTVWVVGQILALKDEDGDVVGHVGAITDISDRKRAEQSLEYARTELERRVLERTAELRTANHELERQVEHRHQVEGELAKSEARLRGVLENAPGHIFIYIKDLDGRYLYMNQPSGRTTPTTRYRNVIGKNDFEVFPQDVAEEFRLNDAKIRDTGVPMEFDEEICDDSGVRNYLTIKFPILDEDGAIYAIGGISTEITARAQADQELRQVFELSPDIMCSMAYDGRLIMMNPVFADTLGYDADELSDANLIDLVHPDDRQMTREMAVRISEGLPCNGFENRYLTKDGKYRVFSWRVVASANSDHFYATARDVTELQIAEAQGRRRREDMAHMLRLHTMGEMASEIAHELNQPLGAIVNFAKGGANRLNDDRLSVDELRDLLSKISNQALRAGEMIRRMIDFARKADLNIEKADVNEIVTNAKTLLEVAGATNVHWDLSLDPNVPPIHVDGIQLEQVVLNLMRNGMEAMKGATNGDAKLSISTACDANDNVTIDVVDSGPGLPDGKADQIFEPFVTTKPDGLGLGLPISRTIVEAHGGRLWADANPGGGTRFHLTIPLPNTSN
jgi:PAS domain S-box-containing protein